MTTRPRFYQKVFAELKRRHVFKVAAVYGAVSFVVLQVADIIFPSLGLPPWSLTLVVALTLIGFPVAVVLAWALELTPEGVRRADVARPGELEAIVAQPGRQRWPAGVLALVGIVALLGGGWWALGRNVGDDGPEAAAAAGSALTAPATAADERASIAVLPFANLSGDEATQPFTDGIHDDILTQLTKIGDLKVISRTSVLEYRNTTLRVRDIAEELGVASVLEGAVQRSGDNLRINVQLIDARNDEHLWAERYNRDLTAANIFAIQSEIAEAVAAALQAQLSASERASLAERPTESIEAYELYLQGRDYLYIDLETQLRAVRPFAQAVEIDPNFALAHAYLSIAHSLVYWFHHDRSQERGHAALQAADRALQLAPGLPEGHLALGHYYYRVLLDYERALVELAITERERPGMGELQETIGAVLRRKGDFEGALERFQRAASLDPRSSIAAISLGETYSLLRRYDEAEPYLRRAVTLGPGCRLCWVELAEIPVRSSGDIGASRRLLDEGREAAALFANDARYFWLAYLERDVARAREQLDQASEPLVDDQFEYRPKALAYGELFRLAGEEGRARTYYDSARVMLEARIAERPEDPRFHTALGIAYAGLGRKDDAVRAAEWGVQLMPPEREAYRGTYRVLELARTYALVGRRDAAIERLEEMLARPGYFTVSLLRLDPAWDPLRADPRFQALLSAP